VTPDLGNARQLLDRVTSDRRTPSNGRLLDRVIPDRRAPSNGRLLDRVILDQRTPSNGNARDEDALGRAHPARASRSRRAARDVPVVLARRESSSRAFPFLG